MTAFSVLNPLPDDWMTFKGIRPCEEKTFGVIDILIRAGWRIRTQRGLVPGDGAAHAETRIGVDVIGTDQSLGEFVENVIVLGEQLARDVERNTVGAVLSDRFRKFFRGQVQRFLPGGAPAAFIARDT